MGAFLDTPKTDKYCEHGAGNGLKFGLSSMQGWRIEMEDAHSATTNLTGPLKDWSFFAVFDGHAGAGMSAKCSQNLLSTITACDKFKESTSISDRDISPKDIETIKSGIRSGFLRLDEAMREKPEVASGEDTSGTTAVCGLISPTHIFVANCGDSRAVMFRTGGISFSTQDHKPINPTEKERIQNAGGSVMIQRVNGSLAVSRALGDYEYKNVEGKGPCEQLVSPEPELYVERRSETDEFLILACDGIWDVMTNEDICQFIRSRLLITDDMEKIATSIIDTCFFKGSRDNMCVVLIAFPGAPTVSEEAVNKEKQLEDFIENKITRLVQEDESVTISQVMQALETEQLQGLPPGGGLHAKKSFIDSIYKKLKPSWSETDNKVKSNLVPSSTLNCE